MRTRVKICGLTRVEDLRLAHELGADAVGIVCVPGSPRCVDLATGRALRRAADGLLPLVLLVADAGEAQLRELLDELRPDLVQFHGLESPADCARCRWPYLKALSHAVVAGEAAAYEEARAIVVDSHPPGGRGGSGRPFDWTTFPGDIQKPLLLAGGLCPRNVGAAIRTARPYGVDVSSGVESSPGIKDPEQLEQFFKEVCRVERRESPA